MDSSLAWLVVAAIAFVGSHFALSAMEPRNALARRFGEQGFLGAYSLVAAITLVALIFAYGNTSYVPLWTASPWTRWIPVLVMPVAALLLVGGLTQYNPTAVGAKFGDVAGDPAPGILKITRNPVMWAIGLWALSHIPPNGDAASLILFGSLAFLALGGTTRIEAKHKRRDPDGFGRLAEITSNVPFLALLSPAKRAFWRMAYGRDPLKTFWREIGLWRFALALGVYVALAVLHPWIAGVPVH